jgi:hypothetical protein
MEVKKPRSGNYGRGNDKGQSKDRNCLSRYLYSPAQRHDRRKGCLLEKSDGANRARTVRRLRLISCYRFAPNQSFLVTSLNRAGVRTSRCVRMCRVNIASNHELIGIPDRGEASGELRNLRISGLCSSARDGTSWYALPFRSLAFKLSTSSGAWLSPLKIA